MPCGQRLSSCHTRRWCSCKKKIGEDLRTHAKSFQSAEGELALSCPLHDCLPQTNAGTKSALNLLYKAISIQENAHPEAALLVAGDFNAGKLKSILPHFYQHVTCATKGNTTLDHFYSTHRDVYKAQPCPPFCKSDSPLVH